MSCILHNSVCSNFKLYINIHKHSTNLTLN